MKQIALSLASALIAAASLAAAARPASAGLDFTDTATFQAGTADVSFSGANLLSATTALMANGFNQGDLAVLTSTGTVLSGSSATIDFSYTGMTTNGFFGFNYSNYDIDVGNPAYTMVVQFGTITGNVALTTVTFLEATTSGVPSVYSINQSLTAADSGTKLFIQIPTSSIPLTERDLVQAVRLGFNFATGSTTSVAIQAVANPEPGTVALFGLGLLGLAGAVRARRRTGRADGARAKNA